MKTEEKLDAVVTLLSPDQLREACVTAIRKWGVVLTNHVGVDEAWRLMLTGTLTVMQADRTPQEIAALFRLMADDIDAGGLKPPSVQ